jgi:type I restriction enzyme S subunit
MEAPLKTRLTRNDGGVWGDDPDGINDTVVLRSTEQNLDGTWSIKEPASRKLSASEISGSLLIAGDLLLTKSSGSELHIGKTSLVNEEVAAMAACYSNFMQRLRVDDRTEPRFVHYWLNNSLCREQFAYLSNSTSGLANLSAGLVKCTLLAFPSQFEQVRIANFLDDKTARIDALIAEKERLAESLKDIEEVTAFDMVTRGLNSNVPRTSFVEPWLGEVPLHWALTKIRNFATVGNGSTPKRDNEDYWAGGDTPWLNSGSVNSPRIVEASDYVTSVAIKECHLPTVRAGSTVVALTGQGKTRGRAAFAEFETTINQHLAFISAVDERISDEYLWVALTGFYSVFRYISDGEGSTKGALTCEELNRFRLPVPPPDEQADIVKAYLERIGAIERLESHNELHIARLREYRSSLISAAVTGQMTIQ